MMGSYSNFFSQTEGNKWTSSKIVKERLKYGDLYINNFKFDDDVINKFYFFSLRKKFENFKCKINTKDLTKSTIVFGQMGSGKSEFLYSLLKQNTMNRYLIFDSKGDFTQKFYSSKRDIILNPYDSRSSIWNPFEEAELNPYIVEIFFTNLLNSIAGDKKDFFSASTKERYMDIFYEVLYKKSELNAKQKLSIYVKELKRYFSEVSKSNSKSENDVISTMKLLFEFIEYMDFKVQNGCKTFTISNFIITNNSKLFLLARDDLKSKLNPFFTAFIAIFASILLSRPDNKANLTGLFLDEYLTFAKNLDEETLEGLHTRIRSKGGCLITAIQYFPKAKYEELTQKILNSSNYLFLFQGIDTYTLDIINKTVGKVRYKKDSLKKNNKSFYNNESFNTEETNLLNTTMFHSLAEKFEHITYIPSKKLLYKGYTNEIKSVKRNLAFVFDKKSLSRFYREYKDKN
ncbi:type IV secretion system DNA-binding domain-containing protein [Arcobacter arenosus]|nr:type IV secretion system DNA-binding domain-containing protein [Arcobacter arenosus]